MGARVSHGRASRVTALLAGILIALLIAGVASGRAQEATPAPGINVAGIVIDYGDGRVTYAIVPFAESELTGYELLNRSGVSLLTITFGGLGAGVCAIEETGCDPSACRARMCQTGDPDSPFWQYAQLDGDGTWAPSPLGASNQVVTDGVVDAWSWSADPPNPDIANISEIAVLLGVDLDVIQRGDGLDAVALTTGSDGSHTTADDKQDVLAATIVGGVAALAGLAIVRSRRQARA